MQERITPQQPSFAIADLHCRQSRTLQTNQGNVSFTPFCKRPEKSRQAGSPSASNGYPDTATILETTQRDRLAKDAAIPGKTHPFSPLFSREKAFIRDNIHTQWEQEWKSSGTGAYLRGIDATLPSKYTRRLYGTLPRNRSYLLTQLRTGHSWLSTYAKRFRFQEDDKCTCGARETVVHVLVDCPRLRVLRQELRRKVGDAFRSVSLLLGGSEEGKEGKQKTAIRVDEQIIKLAGPVGPPHMICRNPLVIGFMEFH